MSFLKGVDFHGWITKGAQLITKLDELKDLADPRIMTMNLIVASWLFCFATAIGSWGGFSKPPGIFRKLIRYTWMKHILLFLLIWQGGGKGNIYLTLFGTFTFYLFEQFLFYFDRELQQIFGFNPDEDIDESREFRWYGV